MFQNSTRSQAGFSILEALISLSIFLAVLAAVLATYTPSRRLYTRGERKADIQQNARLAMAEMAKQIRMAGFFPENFTDPPPATREAGAIRLATEREVAIYGDADGGGSSNIFFFCLDDTTVRRKRAAPDAVDAYTCSGGEILAEGVSDLTFVYYDAAGDPVPDPPTGSYQLDDQGPGAVPELDDTAQRDSVRRVVAMLTTEVDVQGRGPQIFTLTSDIWLRNSL